VTVFSVLEQAPIRQGISADQSLRDALGFAQYVEALGYHRFWIAEHHSMGGVASSAPEVLIGHVASVTQHLRVGSGGMLLPNHRPVHVAEQFLTLHALHPGRIDLGIGRSEGALDEAIVRVFDRPADTTHGAGFDDQLDQLLAFGGVAPLPAEHPLAGVRAGPQGVALPRVFLLGSSTSSAEAAARRGLGYAFAAYSNPDMAAEALRLYRRRFVPAAAGDRPHAILGLKVVVGEDDDHARALALPWYLNWVRARAGRPGPLMSVDDAATHRWSEAERAAEPQVRTDADVVGGPERVAGLLAEHIAASDADEVIVTTNTFSFEDRLGSYARLAEIVGLESPFPTPGVSAVVGSGGRAQHP
jgi:luciferase family oxidoreductase group 1